jgi:hypothetical protein
MTLVLGTIALFVLACAKKEERTLDQRVRALDVYLAKGGTPEPAEIISPILTQRGLAEFAALRPDATVRESSVAFPSASVARFSLVYSVPGNTKPQTQLIEFVYAKEAWNMRWMPEETR